MGSAASGRCSTAQESAPAEGDGKATPAKGKPAKGTAAAVKPALHASHERNAKQARQTAAATRIQAALRAKQARPGPVSLRLAAHQSYRSLPRDSQGRLFPLFGLSLIPIAAVQGVGNMLALRFELEMGLLFVAMFGLHYAAVRHNLDGDAITSLPLESPFPGAASSLGNATSLRAAHGLGDAASSMLFALAITVLRRLYNRWYYHVNDQLVTIADYAVVLTGLPPTTTSDELARWIRERFVGVQLVGVSIALDEAEILRLMSLTATLRAKERDLTRSIIRTKSKLGFAAREDVLAKLSEAEASLRRMRSFKQPCVGRAFAVFNQMVDAEKVIDEVRRHAYVGGQRIGAERAPEPSDVLWENLHIGKVEQASRRALGLVLSVLVTAFATFIMGIARFISPVYGDSEHKLAVKILAPLCIVVGNLTINITVPKISEYEGWHDATRRADSLCVKLALFQVTNSLAGALMMYVYEDFHLSGEWYAMAGQMTSAIVIFTIVISDALGLLRLGACLRRVCVAPCARSQAKANEAFRSADPLYLAKRISLVLKYIILALLMGPFFPFTYLLTAVGCLLSYALDKFNILRQMTALPKNTGHLIVHSILGRLLPAVLALHVGIAMIAYVSRSQQLLKLDGVGPDVRCSVDAPSALLDAWHSALVWASGEQVHVLTACNHAVMYMGCGGLVVLAILAVGQLLAHLDRRREAQSLGTRYAQLSATSEKLYEAQDGIGLYISPVQKAILMELATKRGADLDSIRERSAFTGDSIALSFEAFV